MKDYFKVLGIVSFIFLSLVMFIGGFCAALNGYHPIISISISTLCLGNVVYCIMRLAGFFDKLEA